jgi:uncharacterized protein (TIGR00369 family)
VSEGWPRPRGIPDFDSFPLHRALGVKLLDARPGSARCVIETTPMTASGVGGGVHGGVLAALVDMVMLEAIIPMVGPGEQPAGTADLNITYMRPAIGARIFAQATVIKKGRSLAVVEVEITDEQGRLCAKGRTLYSLRAGERVD